MRVTGVWTAIGAAIGGFMLADILIHPEGTRRAGGVITGLWKTSAQGLTGQRVG